MKASSPRLSAATLLPLGLHKPLDAVAGLDQLLVTGGEAGADMTGAVGAERRAGHDGDLVLLQQADREVLFRESRHGDTGKRVKRAARRMAFQADFVEPAHHQVAAPVILR